MDGQQTHLTDNVRHPWEADEILLFIHTFGDRLCTISGKQKKTKLCDVSTLLRARGRQLGYDLYPTYRNVRSMENLFYLAKRYLKSGTSEGMHPLLKDCLDLFLNDRPEFERMVTSIPPIQLKTDNDEQTRTLDGTRALSKIGQYGAIFKLKDVSGRKTDIIEQLKHNYSKISDFKLEKSEKQSWLTSIDTLKQAYKELDRSFGELDVVMEYVMPLHKPGSTKAKGEHSIRSDAVIVSSKTVLILEFKQRDTGFEEGFIKQAGKYQTRMNRYHVGSTDMIIKSVLVLTKAENHLRSFGMVASCSADKLSDALALMFEPIPDPIADFRRWLESGFQTGQ